LLYLYITQWKLVTTIQAAIISTIDILQVIVLNPVHTVSGGGGCILYIYYYTSISIPSYGSGLCGFILFVRRTYFIIYIMYITCVWSVVLHARSNKSSSSSSQQWLYVQDVSSHEQRFFLLTTYFLDHIRLNREMVELDNISCGILKNLKCNYFLLKKGLCQHITRILIIIIIHANF